MPQYTQYEDIMGLSQIEAQVEKERLANALALMKVKEAETNQRMKDQLVDMMQGYGTPGERMGQMGGNQPALAQAMEQFKAQGQTPSFTDYGGSGEVWAKGNRAEPSMEQFGAPNQNLPMNVGMQTIQPRMNELAQLMAQRSLGIEGHTPSQTIAIDKAKVEEQTKMYKDLEADKFKRQKEEDVAREERLLLGQGEAQRKEKELLVPQTQLKYHDANLSRIEKREESLATIYSKEIGALMVSPFASLPETTQGQLIHKRAEALTIKYNKEVDELQKQKKAVHGDMQDVLVQMGILPRVQKQETKGSPDLDLARTRQAIEGRVGPTAMAEMARKGVTPEAIMAESRRSGRTVDDILDEIMKIDVKEEKKEKKLPSAKIAKEEVGGGGTIKNIIEELKKFEKSALKPYRADSGNKRTFFYNKEK
jgi:hypothetical protein